MVRTPINSVLFDTGAHGPTLLYNLEALGFPPEEIDTVVLSHIDSDHTGGLFKFLERNNHVSVYVPQSFPQAFKDLILMHGASTIDVDTATEICPGVETTGELGEWLKEQALIVRGREGIALLIADAHPGIINVIESTRNITKDRLYLVMGGFHTAGLTVRDTRTVVRSLKRLGVEHVGACHSSGDRARYVFQEEYQNNYIESGVGKIINYP